VDIEEKHKELKKLASYIDMKEEKDLDSSELSEYLEDMSEDEKEYREAAV